jgi:hypothetical protein
LVLSLGLCVAAGCRSPEPWPAPPSGKAEDLVRTLNSTYGTAPLTIDGVQSLTETPGFQFDSTDFKASLAFPLETLLSSLGVAGDASARGAITTSLVEGRVNPKYYAPVYVFHPLRLLDTSSRLRSVRVTHVKKVLAWEWLADLGTTTGDLTVLFKPLITGALADLGEKARKKGDAEANKTYSKAQAVAQIDSKTDSALGQLAVAYSHGLLKQYGNAVGSFDTSDEALCEISQKVLAPGSSFEILDGVTVENRDGKLGISGEQAYHLFLQRADGMPDAGDVSSLPSGSRILFCRSGERSRAPVVGILVVTRPNASSAESSSLAIRFYEIASWIADLHAQGQLTYEWSNEGSALVPIEFVKWGFPEEFVTNFDNWLTRRGDEDRRVGHVVAGKTLECGAFALEQAGPKDTSMSLRRYVIQPTGNEISFSSSAASSNEKNASALLVLAREVGKEFTLVKRGEDEKFHIPTPKGSKVEVAIVTYYDEPIYEKDYFTIHVTEFAREGPIKKLRFLVASTKPGRALDVRSVVERSSALPPGMLLWRTAGVTGGEPERLVDFSDAIKAIAQLAGNDPLFSKNEVLLRAAQRLPKDVVRSLPWVGKTLDEARNDCAFAVGPPEQRR